MLLLLLLLPAAATTTTAAVAASWLLLQYLPPHSNKARISELRFDPRQSIFKEGMFAIPAPTSGASPLFLLYLCTCFFIFFTCNHTSFRTLSKGGRVYLTFVKKAATHVPRIFLFLRPTCPRILFLHPSLSLCTAFAPTANTVSKVGTRAVCSPYPHCCCCCCCKRCDRS